MHTVKYVPAVSDYNRHPPAADLDHFPSVCSWPRSFAFHLQLTLIISPPCAAGLDTCEGEMRSIQAGINPPPGKHSLMTCMNQQAHNDGQRLRPAIIYIYTYVLYIYTYVCYILPPYNTSHLALVMQITIVMTLTRTL
jgi:hypothetical protein